MKSIKFVWFGIVFVFSLFICAPLPVLACGGGGGGGGESGPTGLGGPQSSTAGRPAGATFGRPTGSSFGQPGTAAYVGGINMGTPAPVAVAHGSYNPQIGDDGLWRPSPPPESLEERQQRLIEEQRLADIETTLWNFVTPVTEGVGIGTKVAVWALAYKTGVGWVYTLTMAGARAGAEGLGERLAGKDGEEIQRVAFGVTVEAMTSYLPPGFDISSSLSLDRLAEQHIWQQQVQNRAPAPAQHLNYGYADRIIDQDRARKEVAKIDQQMKATQAFFEQRKDTMTRQERELVEKTLSDLQSQRRAAERRMY